MAGGRTQSATVAALAMAWTHAANAPAADQGAAAATVVFPFELADTSGEGPKPGQPERLDLATRTLVRVLESSGRYRAVDLAPFAAEVAATGPRYACGDCWLDLARRTSATLAVVPSVHKVSTLVSTMNLWVADLRTGTYIARIQGQIRGDDDRAYVRGVEFLAGERLLKSD